MYHSFFILLVSIINFILCNQSNPGHLQPFGTVGSLKNIEEINGIYPDILTFFTYYISKSEPIISRQVLINDLNYNIWKTDEELEKEIEGISKLNIHVQSLIQHQRIQMKFTDFIDKYQKEHLIFADNLPEIFHQYLVVPHPLQCNAVLPTLQSASIVVNDINTSPLIFNEEYDPFLCLFRGNKRVVLVNANKYPDVRQIVISRNRQTPINPDKVDFNQFPALANIDYHIANLTAGDCLLIPSGWIFQERSLDSTIAIIYNIHHKQALDVDLNAIQTCTINETYDSSFTLDQIDWSSIENKSMSLKEVMINLINSKSNTFDKWQETFSKHLSFDLNSNPETSAIFDEFYDIIDVNGDGEITINEIEQINGVHQHHISEILYEMVQLANDKQQTNPSKEVHTEIENEEIDDNLHLQNYKTDL